MSDTCDLLVSIEDSEHIRTSEAIVVREYERADGSRFGNVIAWGDAEEMKDVADAPSLLVLPVGVTCICQSRVMVSDLLGDHEGPSKVEDIDGE